MAHQQHQQQQQQQHHQADQLLPSKMWVPADDENYTCSFSVDELVDHGPARDFFDKFGFIVVRDVLSPAECAATISEMYDTLEEIVPGLDRNDERTLHLWKCRAFGMPSRDPLFTPQLLRNRQNPNVFRAFSFAIDRREDLLVSHDRWTIYRATESDNRVGPDGEAADPAKWKTRGNLHLDINPWHYVSGNPQTWRHADALRYGDLHDFIAENNLVTGGRGRQAQGVLNLADNREEDGGFQVVPGFHNVFEDWVKSLGPMPTQGDFDGPKYAFAESHAINKKGLGQRVTMRAGSIVVWDQRCVHGSLPNRSDRPRMAQFMKMFPAACCIQSRERAVARREALLAQIRRHGFEGEVSELGRRVFGL